ncbi:MAG: phosphatidate cytidylyltransferase [Bacteroidales bacterium]|nr:phosphatidate cytidylyltransferase [Bacteroidales bacterium]
MKNLFIRTITGLFFVSIIIGSIAFSKYGFLGIMLIIIVLGLWEFYNLSYKTLAKPQIYYGIIIGTALFISNYLVSINNIDQKIFIFFIPLITLIFLSELYRDSKRPFNNIAFTILGLIYIAFPIALFNYFVFSYKILTVCYNPNILLGFFLLLWANDTGAYIVGVSIGKHRLFVRISPKKSWEGFFGGAIASLGIAYLLSKYYTELILIDWLIISIIIVIMATLGDLVESIFKRSINIKDSGRILPGHGGILDRFDGVFLSSPIVFVYLQLINNY